MEWNDDRPSTKLPYPYNIVEWLNSKTEGEYEFSPSSVRRLVEQTFTDKESRVAVLRWSNHMTFDAVAKEMGLSRERIRQIEAKALRKMVHPARLAEFSCVLRKELTILLAEKAKIEERLAKAEERIDALIEKIEPNAPKQEQEERNPILDMEIAELDLSVRSYNCLGRYFKHYKATVGDILTIDEDDFYNIRNLGRKSAEEIITKVHWFGLKMKWEREGE